MVKFNAAGPDGLVGRKAPGRPSRLALLLEFAEQAVPTRLEFAAGIGTAGVGIEHLADGEAPRHQISLRHVMGAVRDDGTLPLLFARSEAIQRTNRIRPRLKVPRSNIRACHSR